MTGTDFKKVERGFRDILEGLGVVEGPHTEETATRAAKAWFNELCRGLTQEPPPITLFPTGNSELVVVRKIPVRSMCAHHLLPFVGTAVVGYIPGKGQLLGVSKVSRIVDYAARRPQVQEDLTTMIADEMAQYVVGYDDKGGVGVVIRANHFCMELRGVNHTGDMVTSALRGVFSSGVVRDEFLRLAESGL